MKLNEDVIRKIIFAIEMEDFIINPETNLESYVKDKLKISALKISKYSSQERDISYFILYHLEFLYKNNLIRGLEIKRKADGGFLCHSLNLDLTTEGHQICKMIRESTFQGKMKDALLPLIIDMSKGVAVASVLKCLGIN